MLKLTKALGTGLHEILISTVLAFIKFQLLLHYINKNYTKHVKMLKEIQDLRFSSESSYCFCLFHWQVRMRIKSGSHSILGLLPVFTPSELRAEVTLY
jgi:hypothetical protein